MSNPHSFLGDRSEILPHKGQLSIERTIENPYRFLYQSEIWFDVHEFLTQGVNIYFLSGNIIFFQSYIALNFLSPQAIWASLWHLLQKHSSTFKIWHVCN